MVCLSVVKGNTAVPKICMSNVKVAVCPALLKAAEQGTTSAASCLPAQDCEKNCTYRLATVTAAGDMRTLSSN